MMHAVGIVKRASMVSYCRSMWCFIVFLLRVLQDSGSVFGRRATQQVYNASYKFGRVMKATAVGENTAVQTMTGTLRFPAIRHKNTCSQFSIRVEKT